MLILVAASLLGGLTLPAFAHTDHDFDATTRWQAQPTDLAENAGASDAEHRASVGTRPAEVCVYSALGTRQRGEAVNALVIFARNATPCFDDCRYDPCPWCHGCCGIGGSCASSCANGHGALMAMGPPQLDLSPDGRPLLGSGRITGGRDPSPALKPPQL